MQEREKGSAEELEAAKQEAQSVTEAFNTVRQARFDAFMDAFTHISGVIDRIFKVRNGVAWWQSSPKHHYRRRCQEQC